jgi:hypothetical protein
MSLTARAKKQIMQVMNEAAQEERILGTVVQNNGVYEETFRKANGESPTDKEKAFAIITSRVPISSADDIIGMLVVSAYV